MEPTIVQNSKSSGGGIMQYSSGDFETCLCSPQQFNDVLIFFSLFFEKFLFYIVYSKIITEKYECRQP